VKQPPKHPKIYGTVISRDRVYFTVRTDSGEDLQVQIAYKSGGGHHGDVQPGTRVKVYQRPNEKFFRYRLLGE
jgi:hypothetical protein